MFVCARTGVHMHLSFYFGHKSKLLRTCGRFSGVKFALCDQEYGGRGLDSGVVALVKQITMHQHSKLFGTAMKWSC